MIKYEGTTWVLYSQDGKKKLGSFRSKSAAERRERQVEFFKKREMAEGYSPTALEARIQLIRDAWAAHCREMAGESPPGESYEYGGYVEEVREASLIVCRGVDYYEVAYAIDGKTGEVLFEEPVLVKLMYVAESRRPAERAMLGLLEALPDRLDEIGKPLPEGSVWKVRVLVPGFSRNSGAAGLPRYYPEAVLQDATPRFAGVRIFEHAAGPHVEPGRRRSQDVVGWLEAPAYERGITAEFRCVDPPLRAKLVEAFGQGKRDLLGFSINAPGREEPGEAEGLRASIVRELGRPHSVDVVTDPAAGGEFVTLVASIDPIMSPPPGLQEVTMNREHLLALLKATRPALLENEPAGGWTLDQLQAKLTEALTPPPVVTPLPTRVEPVVVPAVTPAVLPELVKLQEAARQTQQQLADLQRQTLVRDRQAIVSATIGVSNLVRYPAAKVVVEKRMAELLETADPAAFEKVLKDTIADQLAVVQAAQPEPGRVTQFGGRAHVTVAEAETWSKAMDGMLAGADLDKVPRFRSPKHAYAIIKGVHGPIEFISASQMLREAVAYQPKTEYGLDNPLRESVSTGSWAELLGDSITRRMLAEYSTDALQTWRRIVSEVSGPRDFRTNRRMRLGGYGDLPTVSEGGTYLTMSSPTDEEATYAVSKKGGTDDFTFEAITNDDVGALRRIPQKLGRAAARTLYKAVFDLLANNGLVYDGVALANAAHGSNTGTTALGDAALKTAIQAMRDQLPYGVTGEPLGTLNSPRFLLVPNELEDMAFRLTQSLTYLQGLAGTGGLESGTTPNLIRGRYGSLEPLVLDYWTDPTNWWLVADPGNIPTIEVGFLNGQEMPELFVQDQPNVGSNFTADKVTYKIRHIWGVAVLDVRGFYGAIVA